MTTQERAEKILIAVEYGRRTWDDDYREELKMLILSQLEEAVREAIENAYGASRIEFFNEGFAAAREKAAGIAFDMARILKDKPEEIYSLRIAEQILAFRVDK